MASLDQAESDAPARYAARGFVETSSPGAHLAKLIEAWLATSRPTSWEMTNSHAYGPGPSGS